MAIKLQFSVCLNTALKRVCVPFPHRQHALWGKHKRLSIKGGELEHCAKSSTYSQNTFFLLLSAKHDVLAFPCFEKVHGATAATAAALTARISPSVTIAVVS